MSENTEKQAENLDEQKAAKVQEASARLDKSDVDVVAGGRKKPIVTPEL